MKWADIFKEYRKHVRESQDSGLKPSALFEYIRQRGIVIDESPQTVAKADLEDDSKARDIERINYELGRGGA